MSADDALRTPAIRRLAGRAARRITVRPCLVRLRVLRMTDVPDAKVDVDGLLVDELVPSDWQRISQLSRLGFYVSTPDQVRMRLAQGERCFVATVDGNVVAFLWVVSGSYGDWALARRLVFRPNEFYYLGATTDPDWRGSGVMVQLGQTASRRLATAGPATFLAFIRSTNTSSLRLVAKLGFERTGTITLVTLPLGVRVQWIGRSVDLLPANRRVRFDAVLR